MAPKISVIMPMYNVEKYVELAISSLLEQTFKDFELILIDDASTDRTLAIAKSFNDPRIQIIVNESNLGGGWRSRCCAQYRIGSGARRLHLFYGQRRRNYVERFDDPVQCD